MNKNQAELKGYNFSGVFSQDPEEVKTRILEEKKKGNKAVIVKIPPNPYSRGHHGMGYSMYLKKSSENIKNEKLKNCKLRIESLLSMEEDLKKKIEDVEKEIAKEKEILASIV